MEPEEIIPERDAVPNFREELRRIIEEYDIDEEISCRGVIFVNGNEDGILIKTHGARMDFDKGQEIIEMSIETDRHRVDMVVEDMFVSGAMIEFMGFHETESYRVFP